MDINNTTAQNAESDEIKQLKKSAEEGNTWAQSKLGNYYYEGNGIEPNLEEAIKWLKKAAENGERLAQLELGEIYKNDVEFEIPDFAVQPEPYREAVKWFRKAAEQGHPDACFELGFSYNYGEGVDQNYDEAVKWYRKAIEIGKNIEAKFHLGECYHYGWGVQQNEDIAIALYKSACEIVNHLGSIEALVRDQHFIYMGHGVSTEEKETLEKAERGDAESQCKIGEWYNSIFCEVSNSKEKAVEWYTKAAEQNYSRAQIHLGDCYFDGRGIEQNFNLAQEWYIKGSLNAVAEWNRTANPNDTYTMPDDITSRLSRIGKALLEPELYMKKESENDDDLWDAYIAKMEEEDDW